MLDLARDRFGLLVAVRDGATHEGVVPVRAFPISAPDEGISLLGADGHEVVWIERVGALPEPMQLLIAEALAAREFMPEILGIKSVSAFSTPSTWIVTTDRGESSLVLKSEDSVRRLSPTRLLIADSGGIHYLVGDLDALDKTSRRLLDRFL